MVRNRNPMLLALLALLVNLPMNADAQARPFEGTFTYAPQESDNIEQAINRGIARMNFALRPIARSRLRGTNVPYRTITISNAPNQVTVTTDGTSTTVAPPDGTPVQWRRADGEQMQVSLRWDGGRLTQRFMAEDGQRQNVYSLSPDGNTLTMAVTLNSPRLPEPITYNLRYRRTQ